MIRVESEGEVVALLQLAQRERVPVTFRAAGTSLSGQAISDSVLIVLGDNWNGREIRGHGTQIRLQPGVIGAQANAWLAPFGRKIGPDPASINACKIGGIVANNASGMCCGARAKYLSHPGWHPSGAGRRQSPGHRRCGQRQRLS